MDIVTPPTMSLFGRPEPTNHRELVFAWLRYGLIAGECGKPVDEYANELIDALLTEDRVNAFK